VSGWLTRRALLGALAGIWVVSIAAYLLGVAVILPVLILVGTASLLRGGRSLLDRLMLAFGMLFGAICAAGLLFSVWPFGLHPVPIAGLTMTGLLAYSYLADRRPRLPRPTLADAVSGAAAAVFTLIVAYPLFAYGQDRRVGYFMNGEDGSRHFNLFDAIRHVDGYLFLHWDEALGHVYEGMIAYPQGSHLTFAMLDGFVRSSTSDYGTGLSALDHYLAFYVLTYAILGLTVIWALQWLAQRFLTFPRRIALIAVGFAFLVSGVSFHIVHLQYVGQAIGLALMTLLVATLARPPARTRQSLWLIASLLVGVGFSYYLYLPAAGLAVVIWLAWRYRRVRRHPYLLAMVALAAALAAGPALFGVIVAGQEGALLVQSPARSVDGFLAFAAVAVVGILSAGARSSPIWRSYRWSLAAIVAAWIGLQVAQYVMAGGVLDTSLYYGQKAQDLVEFTFVLAAGGLLGYLPDPALARQPPPGWRARLVPYVSAGVIAIGLAAVSGLVKGDSPYQFGGSVLARSWVAGSDNDRQSIADDVLAELRGRETDPGTVTVVIREDPSATYLTQILLSAIQRTSGITAPGIHTGAPLEAPDRPERLVESLANYPVLIIVDSAKTQALAEAIADRHPEQEITVARMFG
jgi:hypothetical protein